MFQDLDHHSPHMKHCANSGCVVVWWLRMWLTCVCVSVCVADMMAELADLVEGRRQATKLTNRCHNNYQQLANKTLQQALVCRECIAGTRSTSRVCPRHGRR